MEKAYQPKIVEEKIYHLWEKGRYFTPKIDKSKKPFTIILPLPNANDPLHMGHALFTIEDIMVRYHRMLGEPTLWLPGADHAGIETQFVFEKELAKKGKSRFDYDRETLYGMISDYVEKNRLTNKDQLKKMGFSLDWTRYHYSLEPEIVEKVLKTFRKLHKDGLIYRGERIVNYCTRCGTAFSDLEVDYEEQKDPLFYMKYGPFVLATTRPETKFGDTAVAVNPKDKRYKQLVGTEFTYNSLIGPRKMKVVADSIVDQEFGTGAVKVTPAHDPNDFEIAQRHHLPIIKVIDPNGRLNSVAGRFAGLTTSQAREKVVEELKKKGDLVKIDNEYIHRVGHCYRCHKVIEPMVIPQWFVKVESLAKPAKEAIVKKQTKIFPKKRFEKMYLDWLNNIHDWNISRQVVWGPRIPIWYCLDCNKEIIVNFIDKKGQKISGQYGSLIKKYRFEEMAQGLQSLLPGEKPSYALNDKPCKKCGGKHILQETDTFDTWFLSGQWPLTTLGYPDGEDFKYFYPTSVMDTLWDILFFWVARMMMFGLYCTKKVPFEVIHLHCRVVDNKGQKMSKSKGNVINPIDMIEKYGADALRLAVVFGAAPGSDIRISDDRIRSMRNFINKIWNASRFIFAIAEGQTENNPNYSKEDKAIVKELKTVIKNTTINLDNYRFDLAIETIYQFFWHSFCDKYIESVKNRREEARPTLLYVLLESLKLLHPFVPFITEEIYQMLPKRNKALIIEEWPK